MGRYRMLAVGCSVALLLGGCAFSGGEDGARILRPSGKGSKIDELTNALAESRSESDQWRQTYEQLKQEIEKIDTEVQVKRSQIESLNQTIDKQAVVISLQNSIIRLFDDSQGTLQESIREQIQAGSQEMVGASRSVKYVISNKFLFQPNGVSLSDEGKALLTKLAEALFNQSHLHIRVLGHTDDRPLKSSARYADNWELSAARAVAVVRFLAETQGIAPERLTAVGCGQFVPLADNATEAGRSINRRIEIILEAVSSPAATVEIPTP